MRQIAGDLMLELFGLQLGNLSSATPGILLAFGFATGLQHATEADHVAAVATLVSRNRRLSRASLLGAFWGFGHTLTLFLTGLAVLLLAISIPARLALSFEFGVGVMLVMLGLSAIGGVRMGWFTKYLSIFASRHTHPHAHGNKVHVHHHAHHGGHDHSHKSLMIGMVHGLAGSAALMLLVLSTVDSMVSGLAYIAIFGAGSVVGMLMLSTLIGLPFVLTAKRLDRINRIIGLVAAAISIGLGISIMYEIGFMEQLFIT